MQALARANEVRLKRANLKKELYAGETLITDVLRDPPDVLDTMPVYDLLIAQRRWGHLRAVKILNAVPINETKMIGALTQRQRDALVSALTPQRRRSTDN